MPDPALVLLAEGDALPDGADGLVVGRNEIGRGYTWTTVSAYTKTTAAPHPIPEAEFYTAIQRAKREADRLGISAVYVMKA